MTDSSDSKTIESTASEEYLQLLMRRDRQIRYLNESNVTLSEQLRLKDLEIATLQQQLAQSRQEVLRLHQASNEGQKREQESTDEERAPTRPHRQRKAREIEPDTVQRLRRDRKSEAVVCEAALLIWNKLLQAGFVDERMRPTYRCSHDVAALIVNRMQTQVDPAIHWAFFNRYWKITNLQSFLRRPSYKGQRQYAEINRIFGLPDDAPVCNKSQYNV